MNICFVTPRFPHPIYRGDTLRAFHQIRELSRNHSVHLIAGAETPVAPTSLAEMQKYCSGIDIVKIGRLRSYFTLATRGLTSRTPLQVLYFSSPTFDAAVACATAAQRFDVIHAMTVRVAPAVMNIRAVPVVVDFMDSFEANIATRRALVGPLERPIYDLELGRISAYEREVAKRAAGGLVIAALDRDTIAAPGLAVIPNGVDREAFRFSDGPRDAATLVFTGNMGYGPNVDAVTWFAAECWPALRARRPGLIFKIVGVRPTPAVAALGRQPGIEVIGRVESMVPYLHAVTVAVCPIRCGSGMQNKLLEAFSTGAPVVTTEFANRGIGALPGRDVQVAADGAEFVERVWDLLCDPDQRARQARAARAWLEATYGWSRHVAALVEEYRRAIDASTPAVLSHAG